MDSYPITARSLERFCHIDGDQLERQYKEHLSDFKTWEPIAHAHQWLLFPENIGPRLSIDETSMSNGDLYTIITNKEGKGRGGSLFAIVYGTNNKSSGTNS